MPCSDHPAYKLCEEVLSAAVVRKQITKFWIRHDDNCQALQQARSTYEVCPGVETDDSFLFDVRETDLSKVEFRTRLDDMLRNTVDVRDPVVFDVANELQVAVDGGTIKSFGIYHHAYGNLLQFHVHVNINPSGHAWWVFDVRQKEAASEVSHFIASEFTRDPESWDKTVGRKINILTP